MAERRRVHRDEIDVGPGEERTPRVLVAGRHDVDDLAALGRGEDRRHHSARTLGRSRRPRPSPSSPWRSSRGCEDEWQRVDAADGRGVLVSGRPIRVEPVVGDAPVERLHGDA